MKTTAASFVRVFLAIALVLALLDGLSPRRDCGANSESRACCCCAEPGAEGCCAAPENSPAPPPPAVPAPRTSHLDAILFLRPTPVVLPAMDAPIFPCPMVAHVARAGGHSTQSLLCVRTV